MGNGIHSGHHHVHLRKSHSPSPNGAKSANAAQGSAEPAAFNPFGGPIPQFGVNTTSYQQQDPFGSQFGINTASYQQQDPLSLMLGTNIQA